MELIRMLFFAAAPSELPRLQIEAEYRLIDEELGRGKYRDRFDWRFVPGARRRDFLSHLTRMKPHIVHFSGHGTGDGLIFENDDGRAEPISAKTMKDLFSILPEADRPKVVVLSACYSALQADAMTEVVDCAVGMPHAIGDRAAQDFSCGFYLALGEGLDVGRALTAGCAAMSTDLGRPLLHLRTSVQADRLRLIGDGPVSRFPVDLQIDRVEILECLQEMLRTGEPRVLTIKADGTMGKTRLLRRMARRAGDHRVAMTDLTSGDARPETVLARIGQGLSIDVTAEEVSSSMSDQLQAARSSALTRATQTLIADADRPAARRALILIDGFNERSGDVATWVEQTLLPQVLRAQTVVCVVAGRGEPEILDRLHLVQQESLDNFSAADVHEALAELRLPVSRKESDILWRVSGEGHPYETHCALEQLWRSTSARAGS